MPAEVIFMFDIAGVLTTSPYPAARRLAEHVMRCVFERAGAHLVMLSKDGSPALLAQKYSNFYYTVNAFTERVRGQKCAFERLELGEINRNEFIPLYNAEIDFMLQALTKSRPQELAALGIANVSELKKIKQRMPLLADPIIQTLIRDLVDAEPFLCTIEKVSPRMNVLNLLHYIRAKSHQEIRFVVVTNSWEVEGQYQRMVRAMATQYGDFNWSFFPVTCPITYAKPGIVASFNINALFDGYFQSYLLHKRKPYPDIFTEALEQTLRSRPRPYGEDSLASKPYIFLFDDSLKNCEVARNLPDTPFTKVFHVENGACDVYEDVLSALKLVGQKDDFWEGVARGVETEIAPLFRQPLDAHGKPISWIVDELDDVSNNLLVVPPPQNENIIAMDVSQNQHFYLDEEDKDRILYFCAQHIPQYFPIDIPDTFELGMNLAHKKGFATSAGPITFGFFGTSSYHHNYIVTLRTGSYVVRMQPQGPSPYGSKDIRLEFQLMSHLRATMVVPVPKCLSYCDSYAVCGRRFYVTRYVDGEVINAATKLIQPRIQRPYSERRKIVGVQLQPRKFFFEAVKLLTHIHNSPLIPEMQRLVDSRRTARTRIHPLLRLIRTWCGFYKLAVQTTASAAASGTMATAKGDGAPPPPLHSPLLEQLAQELLERFEATRLGLSIPFPEKLVLTHGDFTMANMIFSHRSMEGRSKYPPALLAVMDFEYATVGDPISDVALLTLHYYYKPPVGLFGQPDKIRDLFPTPHDVMDMYCSKRGYMRHIERHKRHEIFNVYLSAMCFKRAVVETGHMANQIKRLNDLPAALDQHIAFVNHLASVGLRLLAPQAKAKL